MGVLEPLSKYRRSLLLLAVLALVSPVFGVVLAGLTGYHEPLDIVAEKLHLHESEIYATPFNDYSVPGLPDVVGYAVAGLLGVAVIVAVGAAAAFLAGRGRAVERSR